MSKNHVARFVFALFVLVTLSVIGRNTYQRYLDHTLTSAIREKNVSIVRSLLAKGINPNLLMKFEVQVTDNNSTSYRQSALGYTIHHLYPDYVPVAISSSELPKNMPQPGDVDANAEAIACLLIRNGADTNPQAGAKGVPADRNVYLQEACRWGSLPVLRCLLAKGALPNETILSEAIRYTGAIGYKSVLHHGNDMMRIVPSKLADYAHRRAVSQQMVSLLCEHGARLSPYQAVEMNDIGALKAQLEVGTPADQPDDTRYFITPSPLYLAVRKRNSQAMKLLLAHGADVNYRHETYNGSYDTVLSAAAATGDMALTQLLLMHGAKVNLVNSANSDQPLQRAIYSKHSDVAKLLLAHGADPNNYFKSESSSTILAIAISSMPQLVPELLKRGADVNGASGEPLRGAIRAHRLDMVREFLRRGAQVNPPRPPQPKTTVAESVTGYVYKLCSPRMVAIFYAPECEETLRRAGGGVDAQDKQIGITAALLAKKPQILPKLLALGGDANAVDCDGEVPLIQALVHAPTGVKILLEHGANPNIMPRSRRLPLELATIAGQEENVRLLLGHGADPNGRVEHGHTALYWAEKHHLTNIAALLKEAGATVYQ